MPFALQRRSHGCGTGQRRTYHRPAAARDGIDENFNGLLFSYQSVLQAGCGGFTEQRKRKCHEARGLISKTNEVSCSYWSLDGGQSATMHDIF